MPSPRSPTICGGRLRGRRLVVPPGLTVRPTRSLVRQALFNMLGEHVVDARVLDLYSGSGALGLEALSRGAKHVLFVEQDRRALSALRQNLASVGLPPGDWRVLPLDARRLDLALEGPFDLVQADPPFALTDFLPAGLLAPGRLAEGARLVLHIPSERAPVAPTGWIVLRHRTYGRSSILVCERAG